MPKQGVALQEKDFHQINRIIKGTSKLGDYNAEEIARYFGRSPETVRAIKRAGTWPQYCRDKQARRARAVELEQARGAGTPLVEAAPTPPRPEGKTVVISAQEYTRLRQAELWCRVHHQEPKRKFWQRGRK